MKKVLLPLLAVAALVAGCATPTRVHTVAPNRYVLCDNTQTDKASDCDGANPEKGITKVCLPWGRSIASVSSSPIGQGVIVTCGPKLQ